MKKLYRSDSNKVFAGIIGGLGEYYDVDPVVLRLGCVFLAACTAFVPGLIAYLLAIFIVPRKTSVP